jgi:iron(III) transport system substrate-binding protein
MSNRPSRRARGSNLGAVPSFVRSLGVIGVLSLGLTGLAGAAEVNVYTYREPGLIKPLFDKFTAATGVTVNMIFANAGLEERIRSEGANSPADMLITTDISRLRQAVDLGITQPVTSPVLEKAVPPSLRAADGAWYALSMRARVIYASKDRVKDAALGYADLVAPRFKGKVCIRDGRHSYNNALIAAAIVHWGDARAEDWLKGLRANLAKKPSGGDRDVVKDIAAGVCDIGVGNTYYVGLMNADAKQKMISDQIRVILPTFENGKTHVNISGFVVAKHAKNKAEAIKLAEWLLGAEAQALYGQQNFEYPVLAGAPVEPFIASFGALKGDDIALEAIAGKSKAASELVDKVGFNLGPET